MRIGVVGFGKMGMLHGALLNSMKGVEVVGIADSSVFVLNAFKSVMPNIKYYKSYQKMIDESNLDAVIVATPTFSHIPIAAYAADRGVAVLIEKPLSNSLEEAEELKRLVEEKGIVSAVGFSSRYIPSFSKAKEILDGGRIGKVFKVNSCVYIADVFSPQKGWRYQKDISGGGAVIDVGVHLLDLLYWYFGEAEAVEAKIASKFSLHVEDEANAEITFKNGIKADFECSWSREGYRKLYIKIDIEGDKGILSITDQNLKLLIFSNEERTEFEEKYYSYADLYEGYYIDIGEPQYSRQIELFVSAVERKDGFAADVGSGCYVQRMVDGIYKSDISRQKVYFGGVGDECR